MREEQMYTVTEVNRDPKKSKGSFLAVNPGMLKGEEGLHWLDANQLDTISGEFQAVTVRNMAWKDANAWEERQKYWENWMQKKKRVHLLALGDVGSTVLIGLKLLGGDCIEEIGICDLDENVCKRWECEMNQTAFPWEYDRLPQVKIVDTEHLFDCDLFIFCASKGIPPVGSEVKDVRMAQFEANRSIVGMYGKMAREKGFQGIFAVVSDPVDPLCKAAFLASNEDAEGNFDAKGLLPEQIQGYGLGVMNARAAYYAKQDSRFADFLTDGRAYGPHGQDLVIANSIQNYDDELSKELTQMTVEANLRTRELGFKPYVAPALSSAAISLILTMEGKWHYSSNFLGGVYMGSRNRYTMGGLEIEPLPLPGKLYERLQKAYQGLEAVL
ncbi:MAG TPA: lactate dehydrogenase [Candidatus Blautia intestinigallinarum]|nr:lactate dehydrogenase [Candidatus Blautia intestinigallinarum]